jgi:hypothetical protein
MTRFAWAAALAWLSAANATAGPDLATIDRTTRTEPAYQTKSPRYCLLVFGPEAATRVWLVLDGDALYVDRDGDGDLTEEGERVTVPAFKPSDHPFHEGEREVDLGSVKDGERTHTKLTFSQIRYRKTLGKLDADQKDKAAEWQAHLDKIHKQAPDGVADMVTVHIEGPGPKDSIRWFAWIDDGGHLRFADSKEAAPVVHFGGPLTMLVNPGAQIRPDPGPDEHFTVHIGSAGVGRGSFAYSSYDRVPEDVFPVVEVEYPAAANGASPVRERYELKQRC